MRIVTLLVTLYSHNASLHPEVNLNGYRIYSIKRRPRINAALDKTPQMEAKLSITNQKNAAFIRGGNQHYSWKCISCITMYLSSKWPYLAALPSSSLFRIFEIHSAVIKAEDFADTSSTTSFFHFPVSYDLRNKHRIGNAKNLINAAAFNRVNTVLTNCQGNQTKCWVTCDGLVSHLGGVAGSLPLRVRICCYG